MNDVLLTLAGMNLTIYGAGAALAMLVLFVFTAVFCRCRKISFGAVLRFAVLALPLCFVLSRLVFVLANLSYYCVTLSNPSLMLRFWDGGFSATGALAGVLLSAFLAEKWTRQPHGALLDAALWATLPALMVERLFESFTSLGLGRTISYDWLNFLGVDDGWGDLVHPVFRYEIAAALIIFLAVTVWLRLRRAPLRRGDVSLVILALLGSTQTVLESLRADGHMIIFHFIRVQQILFLTCAVVVLIILTCRLARAGGIKKSQHLLLWLVVAACIGMGIFMEFRVDRGPNKLLYYSVLSLCVGLIAALALIFRRKAEKLTA